jgi:hypothetical protein
MVKSLLTKETRDMKKYITPTVECYEFELTQQILASSTTEVEIGGSAKPDYDGGGDARENQNTNSNMWNNAW